MSHGGPSIESIHAKNMLSKLYDVKIIFEDSPPILSRASLLRGCFARGRANPTSPAITPSTFFHTIFAPSPHLSSEILHKRPAPVTGRLSPFMFMRNIRAPLGQCAKLRGQLGNGNRMVSTFNIVMRIVSTLVGILMVAMGGIWILQGLHIAFSHSFMFGDPRWALYGAILAILGVGQVVWSNTRPASR